MASRLSSNACAARGRPGTSRAAPSHSRWSPRSGRPSAQSSSPDEGRNQHAINMQSACNQHAIIVQSSCNHHAISRKCAKFVTVSTPQRKRGRTSVLLSTCASASAVRTCRTADGPDEGRNQPQSACTPRCERRAHLQQLMVDQSEVRMHERVGHAPDEERNQRAIRDALSMHSACPQRRNRVRSGSACA